MFNLVPPFPSSSPPQEKVSLDQEEVGEVTSPAPLVSLLDKNPPQQGPLRASSCDLRQGQQGGLLHLLDEEALYPGNTDDSFLDRIVGLADGAGPLRWPFPFDNDSRHSSILTPSQL